jgi:AcrR family transcriptional regulator
LYASLNLRMLRRLEEILVNLQNRSDLTSLEKIEHLGLAMYDLYEFDPLILRNVIQLQAGDLIKDLSPEMTAEINGLAKRSLRTMGEIFAEAAANGVIEDYNPIALGDIVWGMFTGLVLWEESKHSYDERKEFLKPTFELAFKVFTDGLRRDAALNEIKK